MDDLAALRLLVEWGADEALLDAPVDRFGPAAAAIAAPALRAPPILVRPAPAVPGSGALDAPDLAALHAALDALGHPLRGTASTTVAPSGNPAAGLVLVGEAPGPEDDRSGQAYSGPAGQVLDRVMGSAGLGRDQALLTFLVPWRPPGGRPPSEGEIAACLPYLHRLLALVRPRVVVLMGGGPLRVMAGNAGGSRRARGKWTEIVVPGLDRPISALPMLPPDQVLGSAASKQGTWADMLSLVERLTTV